MEELAPQATLRDAGMAADIATDKLLALLGESGGGVPVQINLYPGIAELLHKQCNELVASICSGSEAALANAETLSEPPAAMNLESDGESLQK